MIQTKQMWLGASGLATLAVSAGLTAMPNTAFAQPAQPAQLEEVVVTARRVAENLQEVPVAITAVTEKKLNELGINDIIDLTKLSPGLQQDGCGATRTNCSRPTIRGYGGGTGTSEQSVISYFGEVPIFSTSPLISFMDLENVQVLKGPQGTLFGETAVGGAILYAPKRPTADFSGFVRARTGNYRLRQLEFGVGGPIFTDKLMFRAAGQYHKRKGFTKTFYGFRPNEPVFLDATHKEEFRISLLAKPFDRLENLTIWGHQATYGGGSTPHIYYFDQRFVPGLAVIPSANPTTAARFEYLAGYAPPPGLSLADMMRAALAKQIAAGPYTAFFSSDRGGKSRGDTVINQTKFEITDDIAIRNIFGLSWGGNNGTLGPENDGSDLPVFDTRARFTNPGDDSWSGGWANRNLTNETQITGTSFDSRLTWQGGFYYRKTYPGEFAVSGNILQSNLSFAGLPTSAAGCAAVGVPAPCHTAARSLAQDKAVYAQATYEVIPDVRVTGGYRHFWNKRVSQSTGAPATFVTYKGQQIFVAFTDQDPTPGARIVDTPVPDLGGDTYMGAIDWRVNDDTLLYATYRTGSKTGGVNTSLPLESANRLFGPETVKDMEAGLKYDWRLGEATGRLNVALFRDKYRDIQRRTLVPGTPQIVTVNLANSRNQGAEIEGSIFFGDAFELSGFLQILDIKLTDWLENSTCAAQFYHVECAGLPTATPVVIDHARGTFVVAGRTSTFVPEPPQSASKYRWAIQPKVKLDSWVDEQIAVSANVYYKSSFVTNDTNNSTLAGIPIIPTTNFVTGKPIKNPGLAPGYALADARIDWRSVRGSPLDVGLSVTNVFNKKVLLGASFAPTTSGAVVALVGEPRFWQIEFRYGFGGER